MTSSKVFFSVSLAYSAMLIACLCALLCIPYHATEAIPHAARGCYLTAFGATCEGFWGAPAVETLLSLPLMLFLLPLAALSTLAEAADSVDVVRFVLASAGLFVGASLWAPLIHFVAEVRRATLPEPRDPECVYGTAAGGKAAPSAFRPRA